MALVALGCCPHRFTRPAGPLPTGSELLTRVRGAKRGITTFELNARASYFGDASARKGDVDLLGRRPACFRFEALTPTDDTLAFLVSDGDRFASHERGSPECLTGRSCVENVARFLPLGVAGEALFDLLVGGAPLIDGEPVAADWDDCEGAYRLVVRGAQSEQELLVRPDTFAPIRVTLRRGTDATPTYVLSFDEDAPVDGTPHRVPRTIRYVSKAADVDLELRVREVHLNAPKEDALFAPKCPPNVPARELPCQ